MRRQALEVELLRLGNTVVEGLNGFAESQRETNTLLRELIGNIADLRTDVNGVMRALRDHVDNHPGASD